MTNKAVARTLKILNTERLFTMYCKSFDKKNENGLMHQSYSLQEPYEDTSSNEQKSREMNENIDSDEDYLPPNLTHSFQEHGETSSYERNSTETNENDSTDDYSSFPYFTDSFEIIVTFSPSPDELWLLKKSELSTLQKITEALNSADNIILNFPHVGDFCAVLYNDTWCRAQIKKVLSDGSCEVTYMDYGNNKLVKSSDMYVLPLTLSSHPPQAFPCKLAHIEPRNHSYKWTHEALEFYVQLLVLLSEHKLLAKEVHIGKNLEVELFTEEGINVAEKMVTGGYAKWKEETKEVTNPKPILSPIKSDNDVKPSGNISMLSNNENCSFVSATISSIISTLKIGDCLTITPTQANRNPNTFWAIVASSHLLTQLNETSISNDPDISTDKTYRARRREIVAAYSPCDRIWHRAFVLELRPNGYLVRYVDYGTEEVVSHVLPLKSNYFTAVSPALNCLVLGTPFPELKKALSNPSCRLQVRVKCILSNKRVQFQFCDAEQNAQFCEMLGLPWDYDLEFTGDSSASTPIKSIDVNTAQSTPIKSLAPTHESYFEQKRSDNFASLDNEDKSENSYYSGNKPFHPGKYYAVTVKHVDSSKLYVQKVSANDDFQKMMLELNKYCNSLCKNYYVPKENELIGVKLRDENKWCRGRLEKLLSDEDCLIHFIDFGYAEQVAFTEVRPLPLAFTFVQSFVTCVELNEVSHFKITSDVVDALKCQRWLIRTTDCDSYPIKVKLYTEDKVFVNPIIEDS